MGGVYFDGLTLPTQCVGCDFRDAEYEGDCTLLPQASFESYDEQFKLCPIKELERCYPATIIPKNAVITSLKYEVDVEVRRKR